jgi:hypothetical protein
MKLNQLQEAALRKNANDVLQTYKDGRLKPSRSGDYTIREKTITSIEGLFPERIDGSIFIERTNITSLKGSPKEVNGVFKCVVSEITDLEGSPEYVGGDFWIGNNDKLESLKGAPKYINGAAMILWNPKLEDLHNIHKHFGEIRGDIRFGNSVRRNALGLLLIKGLTRVSGFGATAIEDIFNKYLPNTRGMEAVFECQEELIAFNSQGSEGYAHL